MMNILWKELDQIFLLKPHPWIVQTLYNHIKQLWETIERQEEPLSALIFYRTLYEEWLTLLFICIHPEKEEKAARLFQHSCQLRMNLRLKQLYENQLAIEESATLSSFVATHPMNEVMRQLERGIDNERNAFDQMAKTHMTTKSLEKDERRRRFYRYHQNGYHIETLHDLSRVLFTKEGEDFYQLFYRLPSMLMHGHLCLTQESLMLIVKQIKHTIFPYMLFLTEALLTKENGRNDLWQKELKSQLACEEGYCFVLQSNLYHQMTQLTEQLMTKSFSNKEKVLIMRAILQMGNTWFSNAHLTKEQYQHRVVHLKKENQAFFFSPPIKEEALKDDFVSSFSEIYPFKRAFVNEMIGLLSVYTHGIDLNKTLFFNHHPLIGSADALESLIDETLEVIEARFLFMKDAKSILAQKSNL